MAKLLAHVTRWPLLGLSMACLSLVEASGHSSILPAHENSEFHASQVSFRGNALGSDQAGNALAEVGSVPAVSSEEKPELWLAADEATGRDIAVDSSGERVFVSGTSEGIGENDGGDIRAFGIEAESGVVLWATRFMPSTTEGRFVTVSPEDSHVFVVGDLVGSDRRGGLIALALDPLTGQSQWEMTYPLPKGLSIATARGTATASDRLYVTASIGNNAGAEDFVTLAIDSKSGELLWKARHRPGETPVALALSPNERRLFVVGRRFISRQAYAEVVAYRARDGQHLHDVLLGAPSGYSDFDIRDMAIGPRGRRLYFVGAAMSFPDRSSGTPTSYSMTVALRIRSRTTIWTNLDLEQQASPQAIEINRRGGRVYQIASLNRQTGGVLTTSLDGAGNLMWKSTFDLAEGEDAATALDISWDGDQVFVVGDASFVSGLNVNRSDYLTVAYDSASGAELWFGIYNSSPTHSHIDLSQALTIDRSGARLFVTGFEPSGEGGFGTIAYEAAP